MLERLRAFLNGGEIEVEEVGEEETPAPRRRWPYLLAAAFGLWLLIPETPDFPDHPFKNKNHPQVKLAEEFNRRLAGNPRGHNILVIDRTETANHFPILRDRVGRFAWERIGLAIDAHSNARNLRKSIARDSGGFCSTTSFLSLWQSFWEDDPSYPSGYLFTVLPDGPDIGVPQNVVEISAEFSHTFAVRPGLPFTKDQMQRLVLYHEAFGHGMDGAAQDYHPPGSLLPSALGELHADIAAIVAMTRETHSTTMARSWVGLRRLGALNRSVLSIHANHPGNIILANTYNNGDALEKVVDSLDATLDAPNKAAAFLCMDDDALHARIDAEMEKVRFTPAEFKQRWKVLEAAAIMSLDGLTPAGGHAIGSNTLRIHAKTPELLEPALRFLRQCDAARNYHFIKAHDGLPPPIRKAVKFPAPGPKP